MGRGCCEGVGAALSFLSDASKKGRTLILNRGVHGTAASGRSGISGLDPLKRPSAENVHRSIGACTERRRPGDPEFRA